MVPDCKLTTAMARPTAYRKASQGTGAWVFMCVVGIILFFVAIFGSMATGLDRSLGGWTMAIAFVPLFSGVAGGWVLVARIKRRRIVSLLQRLNGIGFQTVQNPNTAEREKFAARIIHLFPSHSLPPSAAGIQWLALEASSEPAKILLLEYEHMTGSGKSLQEHDYTLVAWPADHADLRSSPALANGPWFFAGKFSRFVRRAYRDRELKLAEFADMSADWSLLGDAATAARFLSPAARRELELSPRAETWSVGAGWVCCVFKGALDPENAERFLAHVRVIVKGIH